MDITRLIRDPKQVIASLEKTADKSLVTKRGCKIYIPARFAEHGLAEVGIETNIAGTYAMVVDDLYFSTCIVNAMVRITPTDTNTVVINGEDYFEFVFAKGSVVQPTTQLVKIDTFSYRLYEEILSKGHVPWYFGYEQLAHLFDTAVKHAGANIGSEQEVTELIVSINARDPKDRTKYYRTAIADLNDQVRKPPVFIPLKNVAYGATNTTNRLAGSYVYDGLSSALVSPATRTERIESILRQ